MAWWNHILPSSTRQRTDEVMAEFRRERERSQVVSGDLVRATERLKEAREGIHARAREISRALGETDEPEVRSRSSHPSQHSFKPAASG